MGGKNDTESSFLAFSVIISNSLASIELLHWELKYQTDGVHVFQVLTIDLEKQAAELQEEELPVATPIINIPHISARWCTQQSMICCFPDTCTFAGHDWRWLLFV